MAVRPSPSSPCWSASRWPERPLSVAGIECVENPDGTITGTATLLTGDKISKTVPAEKVKWETSESPPYMFSQRERAEAREANVGGG